MFHEPSLQSNISIQKAKEKGNLQCIEGLDQVDLFGDENGNFGRLALNVLPCNFGEEKEGDVPEDNQSCIANLTEQI